MLAVIDRSAPWVRSDDRGRRLAERVRAACDVVIEADGPDAIVRQVVGVGRDVRDVVCLGRPSTTAAALTGAWAGGADARTLRVRHLGGGAGLDPWAATLGGPGDAEARWDALEKPKGHRDLTLVRVDDGLQPWACLGLVFAAGSARDAVASLLRGADGRLGTLRDMGRAVTGAVAGARDPDWRAEEWRAGEQALDADDTFVVASTACVALGPLQLVGGADGMQTWTGAWSGGLDALRALGGRKLPLRSLDAGRIDATGRAGWTLDGWSHGADAPRPLSVRNGPTIAFFV